MKTRQRHPKVEESWGASRDRVWTPRPQFQVLRHYRKLHKMFGHMCDEWEQEQQEQVMTLSVWWYVGIMFIAL